MYDEILTGTHHMHFINDCAGCYRLTGAAETVVSGHAKWWGTHHHMVSSVQERCRGACCVLRWIDCGLLWCKQCWKTVFEAWVGFVSAIIFSTFSECFASMVPEPKNSLLCFIFSAAQLFFMITENSSNYNLIFVFNSPLPPDELFSIINEACGEDKSSVSLTQVML